MNNLNSKADLSVCIITKNEEQMLPECLKSVLPCANEIILVDTGSEDRTIEIARSYGCIIKEIPWQDDFSTARNTALEMASYPFILVIDADERLLNPEDVKSITQSAQPTTGGWLIEVSSDSRRKDGSFDTYVNKLLRLFRNHPQIRFSGIIHEQVLHSILKLGYKLENTDLKIIHLGYSHSPEQMKAKQERNLKLLNIQIEKCTDDPYMLFQRAKTHQALDDLAKAEEDIAKSLAIAPPEGAVRPSALNYGAVIAYKANDYQKALDRAGESLKLVPNQTFANFILGETYSALGKFPDAYDAYVRLEEAFQKADVSAHIVGDYQVPPEQVNFRKGKCLVALKQFEAAEMEFRKGNAINPNDIGCLVGLANIAFHRQELESALLYLSQALSKAPNNPEIQQFYIQVESVYNQEKKAKDIPEEADLLGENRISTAAKPLLSLSMIVKDEESMLAGCLDSVKNIIDEIIIVDTGSTDSTIEIAKKYGAKIYSFEWCDDFAAARNESLKRCSGEWILYLDADERLKDESRQNIRNLLLNADKDTGAIICTIESNHVQLSGSTELHRGGYPRLFRNLGYPDIYFQGRVHEQITPSIFALKKNVSFSDIVIEHLGYNQPREVMEAKVKRNYRMLIDHIKEEPLNSYAWYQLGQTLGQMLLFKEAEEAIRFALQAGELSDSVYASAAATLAQLVGNKRNFEESLFWAEKSIEKAPNQIYGLNLKAFSLLYLNRCEEAVTLFHEVLKRLREKQGVPLSGFDIIIPESVVLKGLSEAEKKINEQL